MFKVCFLLSSGSFRLSGDEASAVVKELAPNASGYIQTTALDDQASATYTGMAEFYVADTESALTVAEQNITALLSDDATIHSVTVGMERVVLRVAEYEDGDRVKGVYPFCRRADLHVADFQYYWWHTHGPIAAKTESALSYIQVHPLPSLYEMGQPAYDGITEISWPDRTSAEAALVSRQMVEDQGSDAPNFVNLESVGLFLASEDIIIAP